MITQLFFIMIVLLVAITIVCHSTALSCMDQNGKPVPWWIVLKVPPKYGTNSYGYYDSNMKTGQFQYINSMIDLSKSALTYTFDSFNTKEYDRVAWNDEKPNNQTGSTAAHSKGFIGFDLENKTGFFFSHSIPKYPDFSEENVVPKIGDSQQYYGQHLSCFSMSLNELQTLAGNLMLIKPYVYQNDVVKTSLTQNLYNLGQGIVLNSSDLFITQTIRSVLGYQLMTIYKNHNVNGSIFQDGLTKMLGASSLIAQTWGRPLSKAWCTTSYKVNNVVKMKVGDIQWNETDDHSKWAIAGDDFACFGDMNRMQSQWKRGGAFYCISQPTLVSAVKSTIIESDICSTKTVQLHTQTQ